MVTEFGHFLLALSLSISLIQFLPHSHLLGKTWEIFAIKPNEEVIPLIRINDWNFDWQFWYSPEYMMHLPEGTVVHASCLYDILVKILIILMILHSGLSGVMVPQMKCFLFLFAMFFMKKVMKIYY